MKKRNDWLTLQPNEEQKLRLKLADLSCELSTVKRCHLGAELVSTKSEIQQFQLTRESDLVCGDKGTYYARGFVRSPPAQYRRNLPVPLSLRQQTRALPQSGQERLAILQAARNTGQNIGGITYEVQIATPLFSSFLPRCRWGLGERLRSCVE